MFSKMSVRDKLISLTYCGVDEKRRSIYDSFILKVDTKVQGIK